MGSLSICDHETTSAGSEVGIGLPTGPFGATEGRPAWLTILNIAHELVTVVIMAIIIGVWPSAGTG